MTYTLLVSEQPKQKTCNDTSSPPRTCAGSTHLVLGVHLGHHPVFQKVKRQHLEHVQLMCHFIVDGPLSSDDVLRRWFANENLKKKREERKTNDKHSPS